MLRRRDLALSALATLLPVEAARPAGTRVIEAPIRLSPARILIDAQLNGRGPYPFIIDTGGQLSAVVDGLAKELALPVVSEVRINGLNRFPLFRVKELLLGGAVRQEGAVLFGLPQARMGAAGVLAAGLLTAFDSELDLGRGVWRVWPDGAADRTGFTKLDSYTRTQGDEAASARIYAPITVGDTKVRPLLDTGSPSPLVLDHDTGRASGLWDDAKPYAITEFVPIGRPPFRCRVVRAPSLTIGPLTYQKPIVTVRGPGEKGGEVLGLPFLRTLDLSFDRADKALWIRHNGTPALTIPYGASGVWVEAAKGAVRVADVGTGSPAAEAGVRVGDVFDGVTELREAIRRLNGPLEVPVTLALRRGGEAKTVTFTPRAYL
jgi:hypothetical protein